ncbi:hypothetical protein BXZ70DRAFT_1016170, partial [Cristinia sonorae]
LEELPEELITNILNVLGITSLIRCRQLNKLFKDTIDNNLALQYKLELAINGMEDGPPSPVTTAERLHILRQHRTAWDSMSHTSVQNIPSIRGYPWDFYGGVLARGTSTRGISFIQLPSLLKGIPQRTWEFLELGVEIQDFHIDPAQDLLVIIGGTRSRCVILLACDVVSQIILILRSSVHIRSLSSGGPHPSAQKSGVLRYKHSLQGHRFILNIIAKYLGVLFVNEDMSRKLVVWDWKRDVVVMEFYSDVQCSFAFLSERYILVAQGHSRGIIITIYAFVPTPASTGSTSPQLICQFHYPPIISSYEVVDILVTGLPSPGWTPPKHLSVPFHLGRNHRLISLSITFREGGNAIHTIPLSTFLHHIHRYEFGAAPSGCKISWDDWAPTNTRIHSWNHLFGYTHVRTMHGTSSIFFREHRDLFGFVACRHLTIEEYNPLAVRKATLEMKDSPDMHDSEEEGGEHTRMSGHPAWDGVFGTGSDDVSFPLRERTCSLGFPCWTEPIIGEDHFIVLREMGGQHQYQVHCF